MRMDISGSSLENPTADGLARLLVVPSGAFAPHIAGHPGPEMEAGKERLTRETVRDATGQEIQQLRRDNYELKQLVADLSLEVYRIKKTAIPVPADGVGTNA